MRWKETDQSQGLRQWESGIPQVKRGAAGQPLLYEYIRQPQNLASHLMGLQILPKEAVLLEDYLDSVWGQGPQHLYSHKPMCRCRITWHGPEGQKYMSAVIGYQC